MSTPGDRAQKWIQIGTPILKETIEECEKNPEYACAQLRECMLLASDVYNLSFQPPCDYDSAKTFAFKNEKMNEHCNLYFTNRAFKLPSFNSLKSKK